MEKSRFIQFSSLVGSVTKSIQSMKMEKMAHYGLSAAHTNLLCHLAESGEEGMTQGELAQAELMDKAQVSRVLQNLEEKGYVRQRSGKGLYKRRYTMTAEGRAVTDEMEAILLVMNRFVSMAYFNRPAFGSICLSTAAKRGRNACARRRQALRMAFQSRGASAATALSSW